MRWATVLLLSALLMPAGPVLAQGEPGRITGTVIEKQTNRPLPSVSVSINGTQTEVMTTANGQYTLQNLPPGTYTLRAQVIGYASQDRTVVVRAGEATAAHFEMEAAAVVLQGLVATGYGEQRGRDVTGSVAVVTTKALERTPVTSFDQVLQGTAAGVQVTTASSEPGGALTIRIRGTSSITGNAEPLYVIDGFPIENDIQGSSVGDGGRSRTTPPNPLATLNPSDIESISILKDASATAIYGARGANGVVIITTKQGRGVRPQFTLDYYTGAQAVAKRYDLLNAREYMDYANEFGLNSSTPYHPFPDSVYNAILASGIDTDWQDEIFRTAGVQNLHLSVRGATSGANITRYAVSGGYFDQDGIVLGSGFRRFSTRLNLNQSIGSRFQMGGSFSASQARSKAVPTAGQQNANAGAVSAALQYVPVMPVYRADGTYSYINTDMKVYAPELDPPATPNPMSLALEMRDSLGDTRVQGNIFGQLQLLRGLQAKVTVGADYADRWRHTYYPRTTIRGEGKNGEAIRANSRTGSWLNENTLTYQRDFAEHQLTVLGGYSRQVQDVDGQNMTNTNFVSDITGYFDIGSGTQEGGPSISSRHTTQTLESWLSRVNYSLMSRYLVTLTYRTDGSSRFAKAKKWGSFPSIGTAWRVSAEPFLRDVEAIDELKLRASYGAAGNPSIRPYQSLARLNDHGYSFGGTPYAGYYTTAVGNPNLTWETTKQVDVGFDLAVLDRFVVTADYYRKRTTDLLLQISLPFETGYESALANRGAVDNRGIELALDARLLKPSSPRGLGWSANVNFSRNRNEVVDLGGPDLIFADLITTDYNLPGTMIQVGKPIGTFYGFKAVGVIRDSAQAASITWTNFNGQPFRPGNMLVLDISSPDSAGKPDGRITLDDRTDIGDPTPDFVAGLTNTFTFRNFELTGLLQMSHGGKILNVNRIRTESSPRANISRERWIDRWTPENPDAKYPRIGENPNQVGTNNFTSNLLEDASYVRLRSLTLTYELPAALQARARVTGGRVYVTGSNLFTIADYSGFNPDVSAQSVGTTNRGIDIGAYPLARTFTVGFSVNY